jgi:hypothetical protein
MESPPELSIPRVQRVRKGSEGSRRTQLPGTAGHLVVKEQVRGHGPGSCAAASFDGDFRGKIRISDVGPSG